jgi:hypothetical protein
MKNPSLTQALGKFDRHATVEPTPHSQPPIAIERHRKAPKGEGKFPIPESRAGKKALIAYFDPAVSRQLQQLRLDLDRPSVQDLLAEAINDLFIKYRRPSIA